jgi:hypothetical protein
MRPNSLILFMDVSRPFSYFAGLLHRMTIPAISASPKIGIWPPLKARPQASSDLDPVEFIYGRFAAVPYFTGLAKSEKHSGDRDIAHSFAVREGTSSYS